MGSIITCSRTGRWTFGVSSKRQRKRRPSIDPNFCGLQCTSTPIPRNSCAERRLTTKPKICIWAFTVADSPLRRAGAWRRRAVVASPLHPVRHPVRRPVRRRKTEHATAMRCHPPPPPQHRPQRRLFDLILHCWFVLRDFLCMFTSNPQKKLKKNKRNLKKNKRNLKKNKRNLKKKQKKP